MRVQEFSEGMGWGLAGAVGGGLLGGPAGAVLGGLAGFGLSSEPGWARDYGYDILWNKLVEKGLIEYFITLNLDMSSFTKSELVQADAGLVQLIAECGIEKPYFPWDTALEFYTWLKDNITSEDEDSFLEAVDAEVEFD